jgi:DNA-binding NtrC family response regulator
LLPDATMTKKPTYNTGPLALAVERVERETIAAYLDRNKGNLTATAKELGIGRRTLDAKLDELGLREMASHLRAAHGMKGRRASD